LSVTRGLVFEEAEFDTRLERTRDRMAGAGFDALLLADPANMNYLSGYDSWSFYVHQLLVVGPSGSPTWVGRQMDANSARYTTWLPEDHIRAYDDEYVHSLSDLHPMDFVAEVLEDLDLDDARLGVEMDAYYFTARAYERLQRNLPNASFGDATLLVAQVRNVKSARELELMRQAAVIADRAMQAGIEAIDVGVRESTAAAAIYRALVEGTEEFGGDYPSIVPLMPAGDHTNTPHLTWSDRRFESGEPVIIELAGCRHRYHAPLARTVFVGEPPTGIEDTAAVVVEGLNATLEAIEPGVTAEAVEQTWRESIARYGLEKHSRIGYAMGLGYPPDWGEHTTSFRPGDTTVLEPDMTFHVIPGLWLEDYGVEISETIRVTPSGAEALGNLDRRLFTA
jgi:Xaa-Pro aminopeptidase